MDTGISGLTADAAAHRPPSPVIDERPAATVQPAESGARDAALGKHTRDEGAGEGGNRQARLSDESLRALSSAPDDSSADADVDAAAAARAYRDTQQRASPARPAFDFADNSPPTGGDDGGEAELSA